MPIYRTSDQWVEGSHQWLEETIRAHGGLPNDVTTEIHGLTLYKDVMIHNTGNIKSMGLNV
jgi:hypothetical protein